MEKKGIQKNFIKFLKDLYGEKIAVCDYFHISFNATIETEKYRHELFDKYDYSKESTASYHNYVDEIVNERVNNFLLNNKEKIIVLIDSFLGEDINKTVFFNKSYFKVLIVPDKNGNEFIGKSQGLHISKAMFIYVKSGKSLNKVIEELINVNENKKTNGISGYLTNGYYYRSYFDSSSIISAFKMMNNIEIYNALERKLI